MNGKMLLGIFRQWWWRRGYRRYYGSQTDRGNPYAMNAGTRERFDILVKELTSSLQPTSDDIVLDLGGGNGQLSRELFRICRRVVVLDFCQSAVVRALGFSHNVSFVVADMSEPPIKAGAFTKIFTYSTFPHLGSERQVRKMLKTWDPLLSKEGVLYIGDIPDRKAFFSIVLRALPRIMSINGLKYYFAVLMSSYFLRRRLKSDLEELGYAVTVLNQSPERRFYRERFDVKAVKK